MIESANPNTTDPSSAQLAEMWDALAGRPLLSDYDIRQDAQARREALAATYVSSDFSIRMAARARRLAAKREAA